MIEELRICTCNKLISPPVYLLLLLGWLILLPVYPNHLHLNHLVSLWSSCAGMKQTFGGINWLAVKLWTVFDADHVWMLCSD